MASQRLWRRHSGRVLRETPHIRLHQDSVTGPGEIESTYDWIEAADQVRVLAIIDEQVLLIEQEHYLVGRTLQLPGGSVQSAETDLDAAVRELAEETGMFAANWRRIGTLHPLPGLTPASVHLWRVDGLRPGPPHPESNEADIRIVRMALDEAISAIRTGRITCAASVTMLLDAALG